MRFKYYDYNTYITYHNITQIIEVWLIIHKTISKSN